MAAIGCLDYMEISTSQSQLRQKVKHGCFFLALMVSITTNNKLTYVNNQKVFIKPVSNMVTTCHVKKNNFRTARLKMLCTTSFLAIWTSKNPFLNSILQFVVSLTLKFKMAATWCLKITEQSYSKEYYD